MVDSPSLAGYKGVRPFVLGIVADATRSHESGHPYGRLTTYLRDYVEQAQAQGLVCYVFSPKDVLRQRQTVWGWARSEGRWVRSFFPLPQVAYSRLYHLDRTTRAILGWLAEAVSTQFVNDLAVEEIVADHWRFFQICLSHPSLGTRVPDIALLRTDVSLDTLLGPDQPPLLVVPRYRTSGGGPAAVRISRTSSAYVLEEEERSGLARQTFPSSLQLRLKLQRLFGEMLVAPSVPPLRVDGCPVTIRSCWQRHADGRWLESFADVRIGQVDGFGAYLTTVSLLTKFLPLLESVLPRRTQAFVYELRRTSQLVIDLIEHRTHGVGELAVELAIGADGRIMIVGASTLGGVQALQALTVPTLRRQYLTVSQAYAGSLSPALAPVAASLPQ